MASRADIRAGRSYVELYIKNSAFMRALKQSSERLKSFGLNIAKIGTVIAGLGAGITAGFGRAVTHFARSGDELDKMSQRTGIATDALAELGFAAEQSGGNIDTVENSVRRMQKTIGDAEGGLQTATDALDGIGVKLEDLRGKRPDEQFQMIADGIAAIKDPTMRAAASMEIFGSRQGTALLPMLESMRELRQEARELGIVPTDKAVAAAAAVTDAFNRIRRVVGSVVFEIGDALSDSILTAAESIKSVLVTVNQWVKDNQQLVATIAKIGVTLLVAGAAVASFGGAIAGIGFVLGGIAAGITAIGGLLAAWPLIPVMVAAAGAVAVVAAGVAALGLAFKNALEGEQGDELRANLTEIKNLVVEIGGNLLRIGKEIIGRVMAAFRGATESADGLFVSITKGIAKALDFVSLLTSDFDKGFAAIATIGQLAWAKVIDTFNAAMAAIRAGFQLLVQSWRQIADILGELIVIRLRASADSLYIALSTAFKAAGIAGNLAFANLEKNAFGFAESVLKANKLIFDGMKNLFSNIVKLAGKTFVQLAQGLTAALTGDGDGAASALTMAGKGIASASFANSKGNLQFLTQGRATREAQIPLLQQQLAATLGEGAQGILDINRQSIEDSKPLASGLVGIGKGIADEVASVFKGGLDSDEQKRLRRQLAGQLDELAGIRDARRNRTAPVRAPIPGDVDEAAAQRREEALAGLGAGAKTSSAVFGSFSVAALQGLAGGVQQKMADALKKGNADRERLVEIDESLLMAVRAGGVLV